LPISDDAIDGTFYAIERAQVEARVGESDAANRAHRSARDPLPSLAGAVVASNPAWRFLRDIRASGSSREF